MRKGKKKKKKAKGKEITTFPEFKVTVGIHPKHVGKVGESEVKQFKRLVGHPQVAATGVGSRNDSCEITGFWEFKVTVGIHPKHARKVGESEVHQFKRLVGHPQVAVTRVGSRKDSYASAKQ
ncbi:hypothetical protein RRG08_059411 [Elysia crispata]|uniref:Uncharacterized protein n=1 Tax=Elysia crispata TaxID=231223 RepID=A0AAE0Z022_9GAST|nr:hypothetical protein RRG08_059411 [Elysia crispata]